MPYVPPGPSGMPQGYPGPYKSGYDPSYGEQDDPMYVEPGAWLGLAEEELVLEKYIADQQDEIDRLKIELGKETNEIERGKLREQIRANKAEMRMRQEELAEKRKVTELGLANSPIDFVAYEMYKRHLKETGRKPAAPPQEQQAGYEAAMRRYRERLAYIKAHPEMKHISPQKPVDPSLGLKTSLKEEEWAPPGPFSAPRTDEEIRAMIDAMVGVGGGTLGTGAFGVPVPGTQAISRQEGREYSQDEMAILSSFLRAGFDVNGQEVSYDPSDYWREVQEGWVPTIRTPETTQYAY